MIRMVDLEVIKIFRYKFIPYTYRLVAIRFQGDLLVRILTNFCYSICIAGSLFLVSKDYIHY